MSALSYTRGPDAPILELTIDQAFRQTVAKYPDRDALIVRHQNVRLSWRELDREVERTARGLAGLGLQPGDRIGVWSTNCFEWILLQIGAARAGVVMVNVNPAYRSHELRYVLRKSRLRAIFLREKDARADYAAILAESRNVSKDPGTLRAGFEESGASNSSQACPQDLLTTPLEHVVFLDQDSWHRMMANPGIPREHAGTQHDIANIQYTSGTTGSPKGVLLTHRNLVNNGKAISLALKATAEDRICAPVPLYHCFGCVIGVMVSVVTGAALIIPSAQFDALATLEAIEAERATAVYGVPTMFIAELEHPEFRRFDLHTLRTGVMAGSPCPIEIMRRVATEMHCSEMTIAYGQTESSPVITMSAADDPLELRVSTVGAALVNTEVKVISRENGATLPVGEIGELATRGYLVMKGYEGEPESTAAAIDQDGWLRTGDLAEMQPNGYFRMRGRAKDTIIRGGENIYPREVEEFLHHHPKISDVYVFGVPDRRLGETVAAWIRLKPGVEAAADEIGGFCRGKIAYFKIPQHIRFVDSFPMTVTGKVQKYLMREFEIRERGLEAAAMVATA